MTSGDGASKPYKQKRSDTSDPITVEDVIQALKTRRIDKIFSADQISQIASVFTTKDVSTMHKNSDLNLRSDSYHHTLRGSATSASPGDHNHDGGTSVQLLDGIVISGSRSTAVASILNQILIALAQLGATNATSA